MLPTTSPHNYPRFLRSGVIVRDFIGRARSRDKQRSKWTECDRHWWAHSDVCERRQIGRSRVGAQLPLGPNHTCDAASLPTSPRSTRPNYRSAQIILATPSEFTSDLAHCDSGNAVFPLAEISRCCKKRSLRAPRGPHRIQAIQGQPSAKYTVRKIAPKIVPSRQ